MDLTVMATHFLVLMVGCCLWKHAKNCGHYAKEGSNMIGREASGTHKDVLWI